MPKRIQPDDGEMRVLVVGREGHGKSTVSNALLGTNHFTVGTKTTACSTGECSKGGVKVKVVDTPDVSDNGMKRKEKQAEVDKWKELAAPFPTILLLAIRSDRPYTKEDFIAYRQVRRFWGGRRQYQGRLVVVFTFADGQDVNEVGDRVEDNSPKWMGKVFRDCGGRYIVLKGKTSGDFLDEVIMDDDSDDEDEGSPRGRKRSPKGRHGSPKGRKGSPKGRHGSPKSRDGSPKGRKGSPKSRDGSPKGRHGSPKGRHGSPKSRDGSPKGRKGSPKERRGSGGSKGSGGKGHGHCKPKGGRGRRLGHKKKAPPKGILGLLCCCCAMLD